MRVSTNTPSHPATRAKTVKYSAGDTPEPGYPKTPFLQNSWRSGQYYSNSGFRNAHHTEKPPSRGLQLPHISSLQSLNSKASTDAQVATRTHTYTVSYESKQQADVDLVKASMLNFQRTHYDPITHVEVKRATPLTANRMKSVAQFVDKMRILNPNASQEYLKTVKGSAQAFHRIDGQFTKFNDLCVRSAKLPFANPQSLMANAQGK